MSDSIHPARATDFDALVAGLEQARRAGHVSRKVCAETGMHLYVYTQRCVYDGGWDAYLLMARGLILDMAARAVVATPFQKFFNLGGAAPRPRTCRSRRSRSSTAASSLPSTTPAGGAPRPRARSTARRPCGRRPASTRWTPRASCPGRPTCSRPSTRRTSSSSGTRMRGWPCWPPTTPTGARSPTTI